MKNKKSKIVAPALGLILLSTAASISGSVAWFTANRTATMTAGTFAVVNTNANLDYYYTLSNKVGVGFAQNDKNIGTAQDPVLAGYGNVTTSANNVLTDASLDMKSATSNVVIPNDSRSQVSSIVALSALSESAPNLRDTNIFSAFKWDITFTLDFPQGATKDVGLFFDAHNSFARITYTPTANETAEVGDWYTDTALSQGVVAQGETLVAGTPYYRANPTVTDGNGSTGYGFRMAFIPTEAITGQSEGYGKVWSPFRASAGCTYIEDAAVNTVLTGDGAVTPAAYTNKTVKATNGAVAAHTLAANKVLMDSVYDETVPTNSHFTTETALGENNYLGLFKANPGNKASLTFTIVTWYEGSDASIVPTADVFEQVTSSLTFGISDLNAPAVNP